MSPHSKIRHIIAIASGKGGVGKSTVSTNLALALKERGFSVGLMDADIYGPSQPGLLGESGARVRVNERQELIPSEKHGISFISMGLLLAEDGPVIWRAPMAMKAIQQFLHQVDWGELDYLLLDLPPGTGDVQITLAQQAPLTGAIIVSTPQDVALGIAKRGLKMFEQVNVPILGVIENMSGYTCEHCGEITRLFASGGAEKMAAEMGTSFLGRIPLDPEILECSDRGTPVLVQSLDLPASKSFLEVSDTLVQHLEKQEKTRVPEPEDLTLLNDGNLQILWPDQHIGIHTPLELRRHCLCARCVNEDTGQKTLDDSTISLDLTINEIKRVGRYALSISFSDSHTSGIYAYERLREICECESCKKDRGAQETFSV
ncbi:P-loop NTPase [bacterium]|nr:P-loop NTPase [bacterium]